jgi:5-methyltetrahydropteroyltriglutamate--homocysteine methyltransferase
VAGPANAEAVHEFPADRVLEAGVADARNTKLEAVERLAGEIAHLAEAVDPDRLWIAPSCGLEFLPREAAERKLRVLAETKARLT